ncbi:hypothetical protein [Shimia biformata]|uniref:hypothetical protein n=1 Tax=Shimia biformata TaxID=1294299 RepID=UPI001950FCE6|nr:hypothetical protein [Shimia biformata]
MLTILLRIHAADPVPAPVLRRALDHLRHALTGADHLVALVCGDPGDDTLPELARAGLDPVRMDEADLSWAAALKLVPSLVRDRTEAGTREGAQNGGPYLLALDAADMIDPGALDRLRRRLAGDGPDQPDLVVVNRGWWLGAPAVALPAPDADRLAALAPRPDRAALGALMPDPARLVIHRDLLARLDAADETDPVALWRLALERAERPLPWSDVVWLSRFRRRSAAPVFAAIPAGDDAAPAAREQALTQAGDALAFTGPDEARAILRAAEDLLARLTPQLIPAAGIPGTGPAADLLRTLQDEGRAMALTGLLLDLATAEQRRTEALAAALSELRADLDLALPGPDYLRRLYDRIRAR